MDTSRIAELVAELNRIVPKNDARVLLIQYEGSDNSKVVANTVGYLRLGLIFIKAAFMPVSGGNDAATAEFEFNQIIEPDSSIVFSQFERTEDVPEYIHYRTWDISIRMFVLCVFALFLMGMCIVGLVTTARFIWAY